MRVFDTVTPSMGCARGESWWFRISDYLQPDTKEFEIINPDIRRLELCDRPGDMLTGLLIFLPGEPTTTKIRIESGKFLRVCWGETGPFFLHLRGYSP